MSEKNSVTDILLRMDIPEPETKEFRVKRLSKLTGQDVIVKIRELTYSQTEDLKRRDDTNVHICLEGVLEPDLKNKELMEKFKAETPAELVKKMLRSGEIEEISREIEKLSGFRMATIENVKKK